MDFDGLSLHKSRMMDVRELRLGNLVKEGVLGVCPVEGIEADIHNDGIAWLGKDMMCYHTNGFNIAPIPLRGKWFKGLGFVKAYPKAWYKYKKPWTYQIEKHPGYPEGYIFFIDIDGDAAPPSVKIRYVHELQNLYFALTGEELTIKEK